MMLSDVHAYSALSAGSVRLGFVCIKEVLKYKVIFCVHMWDSVLFELRRRIVKPQRFRGNFK